MHVVIPVVVLVLHLGGGGVGRHRDHDTHVRSSSRQVCRARAAAYSACSWWGRAISCTPIGSPVPPTAPGTLSAGRPSSVHNRQNRGSPVDARPSGASPATASVSSTVAEPNS